MNKVRNILVLKNRAIGDSVIALGAIHYIKSLYSDSHLVFGLSPLVKKLYEHVNGPYDEVVAISFNRPIDWINNFAFFNKRKFDLIIELHQSGRSGLFFKLYSFLTKTPYLYHNHNLKVGTYIIDQGVRKPAIQRDLDGVWSGLSNKQFEVYGIPNYLDYEPTLRLKTKYKEKPNRIILGVVATRKTKMWLLDSYIELARELKELNSEFEIYAPISDSIIDQFIEGYLKGSLIKTIKIPLSEIPSVISGSKFYIGNDTGLKHISVALKVPTYTFFGPEEPLEWHPYNERNHKYFYIEDMPCRTQISHFCGKSECSTMKCLNSIKVSDVISQLKNDLMI